MNKDSANIGVRCRNPRLGPPGSSNRCGALWRFALPLLSAVLLGPVATACQVRSDSSLVTVDLRLVDDRSGQAIDNVIILIPELGAHLVSDSSGHALLVDVNIGTYEMLLSRTGYEEERGRFTFDRDGSFQIRLTPTSLPLRATLGRVEGQVIATETGEWIAGAVVSVAGTSLRQATDTDGSFSFPEIQPGPQTLEVDHFGRQPAHHSIFVAPGKVLDVEIRLSIQPIELEGITVTTYPRWLIRSGFVRRRRASGAFRGRQWTREDLTERDPMFLQEVLTEIPGVHREGPRGLAVRRCRMSIYVNDFLMDDRFDLDMIEPRRVEALEVYAGRPMPAGYGGCGVILVWLQR